MGEGAAIYVVAPTTLKYTISLMDQIANYLLVMGWWLPYAKTVIGASVGFITITQKWNN